MVITGGHVVISAQYEDVITVVLVDIVVVVIYTAGTSTAVRPLLTGHTQDFEKWPLNRG